MKRATAVGILVVGLALVGYALLAAPSDEERIHAVLDQLAEAVSYEAPPNPLQRTAQLNGAFKEVFSKDVVVKIAEVGANTSGRSSLGQLAARASMAYQSLDVSFSDVSIEAGESAANVSSTAELNGMQGGEVRADQRHAEFRFEKIDGDWRIVRVHVSPPDDVAADAI